MRADVNLSVRRVGDAELHTRTEIKNLNSFANVSKAIELEFKRQVELIEGGGTVAQSTLRYNEDLGSIELMRAKENAHGYRYFADPDLPPFKVSEERIEQLRSFAVRMPQQRRE